MTGKYRHSLDEKGRLFVPAKLREELGSVFFVTLGLDGCLSVYTEAGWNAIEERVRQLPRAQAHRARVLFANCARCEPDKQFRFLIPAELRDYAGLTGDVMFVGVGSYAEIWDCDTYMQNEQTEMTPENLSVVMDDLGI